MQLVNKIVDVNEDILALERRKLKFIQEMGVRECADYEVPDSVKQTIDKLNKQIGAALSEKKERESQLHELKFRKSVREPREVLGRSGYALDEEKWDSSKFSKEQQSVYDQTTMSLIQKYKRI